MVTTSGQEPLATVVVLNWNGERLLPDCLDALAKQDLDRSAWQVWVVDNASGDGSLDLLARDYPWVHVVRNPANLGFAGGNNTALRTATTPFIVLLNNDAHPEPDWLRRLLAPMLTADGAQIGATTSKILLEPRFLPLQFTTSGFRPLGDGRDLGALISNIAVHVDGTDQDHDVTEEVLWEHAAYGPEDPGGQRFRWTRPAGTLLIPIGDRQTVPGDLRIIITARAEHPKPLTVSWPGGTATLPLTTADQPHTIEVPEQSPLSDVINNVGGIFHTPGYGADRGYQQLDHGQYDTPQEVFLFCGAAVCLRTEALRQVGCFDDHFFMYYEDTDLSWRLRAAGWTIHYAPDAVVRHLHSASSVEWSPFFTFHVDRNRLLLLAKNAPLPMGAREALRYQATTMSMAARAVLRALREHHRPPIRPTLLRLRVAASFLRLLPAMLRTRRHARSLHVCAPSKLLNRWMQPTKQE